MRPRDQDDESPQDEQVRRWSAFASRVTLTLPFRVDILVRPFDGDVERAQMGVELHVLERDSREPITVHTRRPCGPWTSDEDAVEMLFDLLDVALRHEVHESVRLDGRLVRELHKVYERAESDPGDRLPGAPP